MRAAIKSQYVDFPNGDVYLEQYEDGCDALVVTGVDEEGIEETETLSVHLEAYQMTAPEGHVYVRDYAEHTGLPHALVEAGVANWKEPVQFGPYGKGWLMVLNPEISPGRETNEHV